MNDKIISLNDENFKTEILSVTKLFLVEFWAEWCSPCKRMAPLLKEVANEFDGTLTVAKFNIDQNSSMTPNQYGIRSIPTLLLFRNGEVIDTKIGALSKEQIKEFLIKNID